MSTHHLPEGFYLFTGNIKPLKGDMLKMGWKFSVEPFGKPDEIELRSSTNDAHVKPYDPALGSGNDWRQFQCFIEAKADVTLHTRPMNIEGHTAAYHAENIRTATPEEVERWRSMSVGQSSDVNLLHA